MAGSSAGTLRGGSGAEADGLLGGGARGQRGEVLQGLQTRPEEVRAAAHGRERGQSANHLSDRTLRDLVLERSVVRPDDGVSLVAELVEVLVVRPHVLRELELADEARADHEGRDPTLPAVVLRALGE